MTKQNIFISTCLLKIPCRYDGNIAPVYFQDQELEKILQNFHIIPICPEQMAGLPTPRIPIEIQGGDGFDVLKGEAHIITKNKHNITKQMIITTTYIQKFIQITKPIAMIGQDYSPSCSPCQIYDGTFSNHTHSGYGLIAAYCKQQGMQIYTKKTFLETF
ncbi:MAG: DUF523 domain-containing protein [Planctomycetes bacterium]|jgi:uncharacterized protein YbbK (DUF523 family)|nr:DUF523 domain-containing protein [Planctomycetota bacterium]HON45577.1 DUF523 domain-containing protein [Planctomycetota bacterium]HPY74137.1 DUF523 domain-containing protein [Planctomycetota bacterium]HQA99683.1 DUF523 domain-containing protein [Planctomycetota bacterium]HRU52759.1 DUF523 domain-containing protein [Planctomycetota bacterium]